MLQKDLHHQVLKYLQTGNWTNYSPDELRRKCPLSKGTVNIPRSGECVSTWLRSLTHVLKRFLFYANFTCWYMKHTMNQTSLVLDNVFCLCNIGWLNIRDMKHHTNIFNQEKKQLLLWKKLEISSTPQSLFPWMGSLWPDRNLSVSVFWQGCIVLRTTRCQYVLKACRLEKEFNNNY